MAVDPVSVGLGLAGIAGGKSARKNERRAIKGQEQLNNFLLSIMKDIYARGQAYDPARETDSAVKYAGDVTRQNLEQSLRGLNARFRAAGGSPTGDTEFQVKAQGMTNRVTDPLRAFAAERKAGEFFRKLQALQAAFGAPTGQMLSTYGNLAGYYGQQGGMGAGLGLLGQGLQGLFGGGGGGAAFDPFGLGEGASSTSSGRRRPY